MTATTSEAAGDLPEARSAVSRRRRITRGILYCVVGLLAFLVAAIFAIDTPPGRRFLIDRIEAMEPANGLRIRIGRIDGSIYGDMTISDLRLYDPEGLFFEVPELEIDWRPWSFIAANRLYVTSASTELAIMHKVPELIPSEEEDQPILPGFDIYVGALDIERLRFEEAVTGERRDASLSGNADIRDGRAQIDLRARSLDSGERLTLVLDAEPDGEVFDLDVQLYAPDDGIIAGITGIERALAVDIAGEGTWQRWDGYARIDSGNERVANLDLEARDGDFVLGGVVRSEPLLDPGIALRMTAPELNFSARATYEDQSLSGDFDIRSAAAIIEGRGALDLERSAFDGFVADIRLLEPSALVSDMSGRNVSLNLALDGPFSRAGFRYRLTAPQAAFGTTGVENLRVEGEGRITEPPYTLPVSASASRVTGVGETFGGILQNLRIDGIVLITEEQVVADDLALRSDRLNGNASTVYNFATGNYVVGLDADIRQYRLPGLGVFDLRTRVDVRPGPGGRYAITGQARATTRALENSFFQSLTGGATVVDTAIAYGPDGRFGFSNMRLRSPQLSFNGRGYFDANGRLYLTGSGQHTQYGPLTVTASGAPSRPRVELALANPVPAAGITGVQAVLEPNSAGYSYAASGQSMAGPFTSNGQVVLPASGAAFIDIAELLVADTRTEGMIAFQDGGIVGALDLTGNGIDGDIALSMLGGEQLVDVNITAEDASLGGEIDATVRQAVIALQWRPLAPAPTLNADMELYGLRRRGVALARFSANVELDNGRGTADVDLSGARGREFDFAANAAIDLTEGAPELVRVEGGGSFRGEAIELTPLVVRREGENGWVIPESTIRYADGGMTLAARFGGPTTDIDATMDNVPLSLVDIFYPETGFGGNATGTLRYRQAAGETLPLVDAQMRIRSLTREGFALRPRPVNLGVNARLAEQRLAIRAIMESEGEEILRVQSRMTPITGEGSVGDLIAAAPLFAELEYNGPSETLWQLTGNETFSLSGPLYARANVSGSLNTPEISGALETRNARLESALTGTVIEGITTQGTFEESRLEFSSFSGTTPGGGTVSGRASFDLGLATGLGMNIALQAENAWLIRRDDISAQVTGPLNITLQTPPGTAAGSEAAPAQGLIEGDFDLVRGEFQLGNAAPSITVPQLNVVEINRRLDEPDPPPDPINWVLDVDVDARNRFMVRGLGLDSEWAADLEVIGPLSAFKIFGDMNLRRGEYNFAGRRFELERGRIEFYGNQPVNPSLDIVAQANTEGLDATINIGGTGNNPEIAFTSTPALPQSELLSRLLFGTSITNLSAPEALQLGAAVASLQGGGGGGLNPINAVRDAIGLDRLRILPADPAVDRGTAVAAGFYVTRRLFVEVITDGQGYSATETEFRITRWLSLLSSISTLGRVEGNLQISRDY